MNFCTGAPAPTLCAALSSTALSTSQSATTRTPGKPLKALRWSLPLPLRPTMAMRTSLLAPDTCAQERAVKLAATPAVRNVLRLSFATNGGSALGSERGEVVNDRVGGGAGPDVAQRGH